MENCPICERTTIVFRYRFLNFMLEKRADEKDDFVDCVVEALREYADALEADQTYFNRPFVKGNPRIERPHPEFGSDVIKFTASNECEIKIIHGLSY